MPDLDSVQDIERAFGVSPEAAPDLGDAEEEAEAPATPASTVSSDDARVLSGAVGLSRRYELRGTLFEGIDIDPPRGSDFWELGDIGSWIQTEGGVPQWIEAPEIIRQYATRCVVLPGSRLTGEEIVANLSFEDTWKVARAVRGFFTRARSGG